MEYVMLGSTECLNRCQEEQICAEFPLTFFLFCLKCEMFLILEDYGVGGTEEDNIGLFYNVRHVGMGVAEELEYDPGLGHCMFDDSCRTTYWI